MFSLSVFSYTTAVHFCFCLAYKQLSQSWLASQDEHTSHQQYSQKRTRKLTHFSLMFVRIYAVADTQIFNFNHSVDVVRMRNVSKDEACGDWHQQGGTGIFWQCLTVYWPVLQAAQMWMTVDSVCELYPDDVGSLITSPRLNEAKMGQNLLCLDTELVGAPHWVDRGTALNICLECVCVCVHAAPGVDRCFTVSEHH